MHSLNRAERRRLEKQGKKIQQDRAYTLKQSDIENLIMTPMAQEIIRKEVAERLLEIEQTYILDLDTMVLWTLHKYGWGATRLKRFYTDMFRNHRKLRAHYQTSDTYPERIKLKEKGIDVEAWFKELFDEDYNYKQSFEEFCGDL